MKHRTLSKDNSGSLQWIGVIAVVAIIVGLVFVAVFPAEEQEGLHVKNVTLQIKGQEDTHKLTLQIPQEISMLEQTGVTGALSTASITEDTDIPEGSEVEVQANADIWWSSEDIGSISTVEWDQSASSGQSRLKTADDSSDNFLTIDKTISQDFQTSRSSTNPLTIGEASNQWFNTYEYGDDTTGWDRVPLEIQGVDGMTFHFAVTMEGEKINGDSYTAETSFECQINVDYQEVDASISVSGEVTGMDAEET